jgi:hypothetical protein
MSPLFTKIATRELSCLLVVSAVCLRFAFPAHADRKTDPSFWSAARVAREMSTRKPGTTERIGEYTATRKGNSVVITTSIYKFEEGKYRSVSIPFDERMPNKSKYTQVFTLVPGQDPVLSRTIKIRHLPHEWTRSIFTNRATGTRFAEWRRSHVEDDIRVVEAWRQDLAGDVQPDRNKAVLYSETEHGSDGSTKLWNYQKGFIATKGRADTLSAIQKFDPADAAARRQPKVLSPLKTLLQEDIQHRIAEQAERLEPANGLSAFQRGTRRINKIYRSSSDNMLYSSGFATAFKRVSEFVGGKRKLNILDLASSGTVLDRIDPQQANVIAGNISGEPLPEPQIGVNPTGVRLIDNSKPFNLSDNSQDIITMGRGLCYCRTPESSHPSSCGGVIGTLEGMTRFLMENARVLNKENPHAIALLHGGVSRNSRLMEAQSLKLAEKAAKAVMEKFPVEITFVYARDFGTRDHIVIQPRILSKSQRREYLASLMTDPPKSQIPLRALEKRAAQLTGYRHVVVKAESPAQSRAILNAMISHLERRPFAPKEIAWHRSTTLVVGDGTAGSVEPNVHHLHFDVNRSGGTGDTRDSWDALAPALDKLRWNGDSSQPKYHHSLNYPWTASDFPTAPGEKRPTVSKKTKRKYHKEQKRIRERAANDLF